MGASGERSITGKAEENRTFAEVGVGRLGLEGSDFAPAIEELNQ